MRGCTVSLKFQWITSITVFSVESSWTYLPTLAVRTTCFEKNLHTVSRPGILCITVFALKLHWAGNSQIKKASFHSFFVFAVVFEVMHFGGGWWDSFTQEFIKVLNIYHNLFTHNSYFEIIILFTIYISFH